MIEEFEYEKSAREYTKLARSGDLPADFDQWGLANKNGWTVAHTAALHGHLPDNFDQWELANENGWTVAHSSAIHGSLPDKFDQWDMVDNDGRPVAHIAAEYGHLLVGFNQWGLSDKSGTSVLGYLCFCGQSDKYAARWWKERPLCRTDTDWEVFKKELSEIYQKYAISDHMLDADNDQEALQGALL
jgi:hypothetical protein